MLFQNHKLDDFPFSKPGYGRKVAVVGAGSAGCRIANQLSKESKLLEHYIYVTCDDHDIANVTRGEKILIDATSRDKTTPYEVRGLAESKLPEIRHQIRDSELVFVIAGLGGAVGSGLAPLIAREARSRGAVTLAIVVMPFRHERSKHYFAGGALKQLRSQASGVLLIDNEELRQDRSLSLIDAYSLANGEIALALNKLLGSTEEHEFSVGLSKLVNFLKTGSYSVLCIGTNGENPECRTAVLGAARHFDGTVDRTQLSKSIVHVSAHKSATIDELVSSIGGLSAVLGDGTMQIEYGFSANLSSYTSSAFIIATGFTSTRFDDYDPVDRALRGKGFNMESGFDSSGPSLGGLLTDVEAISA